MDRKLLSGPLILLSVMLFSPPAALGATGLSISAVFLGQPDVFEPGLGVSVELPLTRSLGIVAGGLYSLPSGSWAIALGARWHPSPQIGLYLRGFFLFDVVDGFVPQLGVGVRWGFPLTRSLRFFNDLSLQVPLVERFLQPLYSGGLSLSF